MTKARLSLALLAFLLLPVAGVAQDGAPAPRDWLSWGYDQQRTGWNQGETTLSRNNVSKLRLAWSAQLSTRPSPLVLSTVTAPLVVEGAATPQGAKNLVFLLGSDNTLFVLDAESGKIFWQKSFPNPLTPPQATTWLCSNTANATPVIDRKNSLIYLSTSDGKLRGLDLASGAERIPATDFVDPFSRTWSLNLIDGIVYSAAARGCGKSDAYVSAMDLRDPGHPQLWRFYVGRGRPGGPWGRGGVVKGPKGVYMQTADGPNDPAAGVYGNSVLAVAPKAAGLVDSFTPSNWHYLNAKDLDLSSAGPIIFPFGKRTLLAGAGKEAVVHLLDANILGGLDHHTPLYQSPRLGNDDARLDGHGVWGSVATYMDAQGERFLYVPMWGPPAKDGPKYPHSYGDAPHGSIMAFEVVAAGDGVSLSPRWISRDMTVPDPPVAANGVVYAIQTGEQTIQVTGAPPAAFSKDPLTAATFRATPVSHLILYAFDAETGKELYTSGNTLTSWVHYSEPVVALGKVFVVSWDGHVYAFGLKR